MVYKGSDTMGAYMQEIGQIPLISREEEVLLAAEIKEGSEAAIRKLITSNLRLVVKIAHDFRGFGLSLPDLISEGNIGMMRAAVLFKPERGAKFSSYAAWWIKQSMRRALTEKGRMIRVPASTANKMRTIRKARTDFRDARGYEPAPSDISGPLGYSERTVARLMYKEDEIRTVSLSEPIAPGGKGTVEDLVKSNPDKNPLDEIMDPEDLQRLKLLIDKTLDEREKLIICNRFGLDGSRPKTLEEVSKIIGRTRERVRQIEYYALRKLRGIIEREEGEPSGLEAAAGFIPARPQGQEGYSEIQKDEAIRAYYLEKRQSLSALSIHFGLQNYQIEVALIRTGAIPANPDPKVIEAYLKNGGNIKRTAKELNISPSKVSRERMRYFASLVYQDRQKRAQLTDK